LQAFYCQDTLQKQYTVILLGCQPFCSNSNKLISYVLMRCVSCPNSTWFTLELNFHWYTGSRLVKPTNSFFTETHNPLFLGFSVYFRRCSFDISFKWFCPSEFISIWSCL
jgi:hypothetical protein